MILESLKVPAPELALRTGWELKPEGLCKGAQCVPLPGQDPAGIDVGVVAERLGMPLVFDQPARLWALGPEAGRTLASAQAPDFTLPDWRGGEFTLSSLRGQKVFLLAWAPW